MSVLQKRIGFRGAAVWAAIFFVVIAGVGVGSWNDANGGWIYVKEEPVVRVAPTPVPNKSKTVVTIAGVGFEPNQELGIRLEMGGVMSDIRHQVKPAPKTNDKGAFSSQWTLGRELSMLKPGVHTLMVVNEEGEVLSHAPLVIDQAEKKSKDKKKK